KIRRKFLYRWESEYSIRRLYLLGFTKINIVEITVLMEIDPNTFYKKVMKNIFSIPNLLNEFCISIYKNIFNDIPTEEQLFCGNVNYYLWNCFNKKHWTCVPLKYLENEFKDYKKYQQVLIEKYYVIFKEDFVF